MDNKTLIQTVNAQSEVLLYFFQIMEEKRYLPSSVIGDKKKPPIPEFAEIKKNLEILKENLQ